MPHRPPRLPARLAIRPTELYVGEHEGNYLIIVRAYEFGTDYDTAERWATALHGRLPTAKEILRIFETIPHYLGQSLNWWIGGCESPSELVASVFDTRKRAFVRCGFAVPNGVVVVRTVPIDHTPTISDNEMRPITPDQAYEQSVALSARPEVIEVVNELLVSHLTRSSDGSITAVIKQKDIVARLVEKTGIDDNEIFNQRMLDFEDVFRQMGWQVAYCKPQYLETGDPVFTFHGKRSG